MVASCSSLSTFFTFFPPLPVLVSLRPLSLSASKAARQNFDPGRNSFFRSDYLQRSIEYYGVLGVPQQNSWKLATAQ